MKLRFSFLLPTELRARSSLQLILMASTAPLQNFTSVVIEGIKRHPGDATYKGFLFGGLPRGFFETLVKEL